MALVMPPPPPGNSRPTLRISEIISALKNREYDEGALGGLGGFREGRTFPGPHGNPGATSVTFRHDCQNRGSRAIRVPHGVVPHDDFWNRLESVS